ncbi:c2h2 zinc finger protein [Ophiostoma piceae UAMH 11346]|uniref:C2h2 zinc finger protein n=1 Tax=Ophiostoma piceae (strain UAMH 11346) TaxID=1262450 RepID=S3C9E4_OPHP1|nr:c2h2 zinc finger protein [Ophiostoma piceae UAMH 11346]
MGNNSTKESRQGSASLEYGQSSQPEGQSSRDHGSSRTRSRSNRAELGTLLGMSSPSGSGTHGNGERRETRQEREARRLERERQARLVERERSMREEHVDGGYLVTLGTYVGPEDFNKQIVRQLQIERRLAPFWRGLNDFSDTWTEYQIAAAARGLDVPAADEPPPDDFFLRPGATLSSSPSRSNFGNTLTVPQGGNPAGSTTNPAASSNPSADIASGAIPVGSLAGTSSPAAIPTSPTAVSTPGASTPRGSSSQFKPRAKALAAALSVGSRNSSSTDIALREIQLPHEPFVNGQPIEVFLYKNADECPICFLTYPPYLNHTRCCHQEICSECFVQIKRAEPHYPEGHGDHNESPNPDMHPEEQAGQLISEPACCPYCQQPEFGVTYDPPPFRRGLVHSSGSFGHGIGAMGTAMSSNSSINSSAQPPPSGSPPTGSITPGARRRAQSLSANAPNVITTDRVRPDWATKLATQRAHIARRAAAATALHTAAFLMGSQESRTMRISSRFGRRNPPNNENNSPLSEASPIQPPSDGGDTIEPGQRTTSVGQGSTQDSAPTAAGGARRTNMEDLEELMFREALRQSLATEEERRRQEEKKERKEAKRREKNENKDNRKSLGGLMKRLGSGSSGASSSNLYSAGPESSQTSASASSLSLGGINAGNRRRGNSNASNLRVEASVANAMAVSGSAAGAVGSASALNPTSPVGGGDSTTSTSSATPPIASAPAPAPTSDQQPDSGKGKGVDRGPEAESSSSSSTSASTSSARAIPVPSQPSAGPSHLRQMSSASSVSSSIPESAPSGSFPGGSHNYVNMQEHLQDPRGSGLSLGSRSAASDDADHDQHDSHDHDHGDHGDHGDHADDPSTSADPLFNFGSLAAAVGVQIEGPHAGRRLSAIQRDQSNPPTGQSRDNEKEDVEHAEHAEHAENVTVPTETAATTSTSTSSDDIKQPPEVLITPGTPAQTYQFE